MTQAGKRKTRIVIFLALIGITVLLMLLAAQPAEAETDPIRLAGKTRYETSFAIAEYLFKEHGRYENMTVASGVNYPDALSGCYLTYVRETPLLLVDKSVETQVLQRIKKYTKPRGTVYLIGGPGSVSQQFEQRVKSAGFKVVRLAGNDRYETNLQILRNTGIKEGELLIASGLNYPDSLSASAIPKPLLLVGKTLTPQQKAFLTTAGVTKAYVLGGEGSVSRDVVRELRSYCPKIERIGGIDRYETSFLIAKRFFDLPESITFASGANFPDGLSGGPVAMRKGAPLVLTSDIQVVYGLRCALDFNSMQTYIFGGTGSVSKDAEEILMYRGWVSMDWLKRGYGRYALSGMLDSVQVDISGTYSFRWIESRICEMLTFTNPTNEDLIITLTKEERLEDLIHPYNDTPDFYAPVFVPAGGRAIAVYPIYQGCGYRAIGGMIEIADEETKKRYANVELREEPVLGHTGHCIKVVNKEDGNEYPDYHLFILYLDENGDVLGFNESHDSITMISEPDVSYKSREFYVVLGDH